MTHLSTPKWNNSFLFLCLIAWLGILGLEITPAWSGGPLVVNNGTAVLWPTNQLPIVYTLDQGTLGSFNNSQAATLINTAFNTWNKVSTTQFRFNKNSKTLSEDVTVNNYLNYYTDSRDGSNPIIYDNDGSIINDLYGGNARNYVLGYTTVYYSGNYIVYTPVIMNGYFIKSQSQTLEEITSTVLHEIGHMCGLDHSQFAREVAYNDINTDDNCIPIMFPTSTGSSDTRNTLTLDDQISISALYPTTYFLNSTGTFSGTVKRSGKELPGVNVIARAITDPVNQVATTVTGTYAANKGSYTIKGLPYGKYEVMVESIDTSFTGASGVGQYAKTSTSLSFKSPVKPEYYNTSDQTVEGRSVSNPVSITGTKAVTGIDINVESGSVPDDEIYIRLLAIDSSVKGGMGAYSTAYSYLLEPSGNENALKITVTFASSTAYLIQVSRETSSGSFATYSFRGNASEETIFLGEGESIPLENTRYFIEITNSGTVDQTFTIAVQTIESVPTETPTPTSTATSTSTPSPTEQATATIAANPTPTLPPSHTPTPMVTATPIMTGDVNLDGIVNILDIFSFAQDWQKSTTSAAFHSNLATNRSLYIDEFDLLQFIEEYQATTKK